MTPEEIKAAKAAEKEAKAAEKAAEKSKEDTVTISKDLLNSILNKLEILTDAADKGRLERATNIRNPNKLTKSVNVATYQGRVVVGWRSVKDDVFFDREGKLHEEQMVALFFKDGKKDSNDNLVPEAEINVQSFARLLKRLPCEILEEITEKNGRKTYKVISKDGLELTIDSDFVNAI